MHAANRSARSRKNPDPWLDSPRLADLFDRAVPQPFFKGSKSAELEEMTLTEPQLLEQTAALLGVSPAQVVRTGALVYAKREFLNHKKYLSPAAAQGDSEPAQLRSGSGVAGVADARIQAAFDALTEAKSPITPAKLATRALTGYPTALRWLKIHHPELLPKPSQQAPPEPATVPVEQPKPPKAKPAQKPEPKKRIAAKVTPLPKKLRNPEHHPELLAAKTAQKPPEAATGHNGHRQGSKTRQTPP